MEYKLFLVGEEYIVAQTAKEALADHNERGGEGYHRTIDDVSEVPLDKAGRFEQEEGGYKDMTFREFIGSDFVYEKPTCICWME
ncbi:hypothetical protein [Brevibacillus fortis]|uniref:hypothetical protein n=1 Tax=Brevibacillus fortis TaxID=2126352 RepID=UPI0038FCA6EF